MIDSVSVVVPAANEEALIGACLDSISEAALYAFNTLEDPVEVRTVVVLDRCVDGTELIVAERLDVETVRCYAGQVGAARALGVEHLLANPSAAPGSSWILSTDADSSVPSDWIARMVAEADRGAHLVLGTVLPDDDLSSPTRGRWLARHHLKEGHPHVHGANLGIRADAYLSLGGWPSLATGEDICLAERAVAQAMTIVRTASIPVMTSARPSGRAPDGFADYLNALVVAT